MDQQTQTQQDTTTTSIWEGVKAGLERSVDSITKGAAVGAFAGVVIGVAVRVLR